MHAFYLRNETFREWLRATLLASSLAATVLAAQAQSSDRDTCPNGLVWREATSGDHVCVTPETRAAIRAGNKRGCPLGQVPEAGGSCKLTQTSPTPTDAAKDPFHEVASPRPFLIIAPDEFMPAIEPLVAHKNSTGMPTLAVSIAQLTSRFPGVDDPEKIKRGIQTRTSI
jgi:Peptidase family C25